jgi:predicted transcriptional regulator
MKENEIRNKIIKILKNHPEGLTIIEIAELIGKNRLTVSKYIYGLISEGIIYQRKIGSAKLCYLKELVDPNE